KVDKTVYKAITKICPAGDDGKQFRFAFVAGDERVAQIEDALAKSGYEIWDELVENQRLVYSLERKRHYEPEDFQSINYCKPWANVVLDTISQRTPDGFLIIPAKYKKLPPSIGMVGISAMVVSNQLRLCLEKSKLFSLQFMPVKIFG